MPAKKKYLVTRALPYANGPLHLGHVVEYVQTRHLRPLPALVRPRRRLRLRGRHRTARPIELNAAKQGVTPEAFVARVPRAAPGGLPGLRHLARRLPLHQQPREQALRGAHLRAAEGGGRHRPPRHRADLLREGPALPAGPLRARHLPQLQVARTSTATSARSAARPTARPSSSTRAARSAARRRCAGSPSTCSSSSRGTQTSCSELSCRARFIHPGVANQLQQFFEKGLADWDISRDGPYFGFPIPGETDKFFYVWLDAPIGYIATTEKWAKDTGKAKNALDYWAEDADAAIVHFIGKDIVYFHALFWPAVLKVARLQAARPSCTSTATSRVNGEKMSQEPRAR